MAERTPAKRWQELAVEYPLMLLICACAVYPFVTALDLWQSIGFVLAVCAAFLAVWTAVLFNRRVAVVAGVTLFVLSGAAAFFVLMSGSAEPVRHDIQAFADWTLSYLQGYRIEDPAHKRTLVVLYCFAATLYTGIFTIRRFSLFAALLPGGACIAALFIIGHDINEPSVYGYILAAVFYVLLANYKRSAGELPSGRKAPAALHMASALPLAAAVLAVSIVCSSLAAINPAWMKDIRAKILKKEETKQAGWTTGTAAPAAAFISTVVLGGDRLLDDTVMMEVESASGDIYLRGGSMDVYSGHSWEQSSSVALTGRELQDTVETAEAVPLLGGDGVSRLYITRSITVTYRMARTPVLYAPLKTISSDTPYKVAHKDTLLLDSAALSGFTYRLDYLQPQYGSDAFTALARLSRQGFYAEAAHWCAPVAQEIRSTYLQLPEALPDRVRELARSITAGATNEYDKAKAIESYLSDNYTYTLTPGRPDGSKDFVDQFLFESKEGYCTYYASAMTVLLRCAGIPARYVEGFVLPSVPSGPGLYKVTRKQGHAWPEAYFEGLGWVPFEPTSAYSGGARPDNTPGATPSLRPSPTRAKPIRPAEAEDSPAASRNVASSDLLLLLGIAALAALLAAAVVVPLRAARNLRERSPRESTVRLFGQCMELLAMQGLRLGNGEPLAHFAQRADRHFDGLFQGFIIVSEIYQQARFSKHDITEAEKGVMTEYRGKLLSASMRKLGLPRYLFFKWLWGIGKKQ